MNSSTRTTLIFIVIAILVLIVVYKYQTQITELFGDDTSVQKIPDIIDLTKQFEDLVVYNNDPDGRIGLDKCIENCKGYCVEYGLTGSAYCFPVKETTPKDFDGMIVQNEQKLSFPNVE